MERKVKDQKVRGGFTLIELLIMAAIIALLASIALPKFGELITKAKEASVKGKLGAIRSAHSIYYADTEGISLHSEGGFMGGQLVFIKVLIPNYIDIIPKIGVPVMNAKKVSDGVINKYIPLLANHNCGLFTFDYTWTGSFTYFRNGESLYINSDKTDSTGRLWSTW